MSENLEARVGTAAPGCSAEQSSAETIDHSSAAGQSLAQLLKRPEITIDQLAGILRALVPEFFQREDSPAPSPSTLSSEIRNELKSVETEIKYAGYL